MYFQAFRSVRQCAALFTLFLLSACGGGSSSSALVSLPDPAPRALLFSANDGEHGQEPWISDGTTEGTRMLQDIEPAGGGSDPGDFARLGSRFFFSAHTSEHGRELWKTTNNTDSVELVAEVNPGGGDGYIGELIAFEGELFFVGNDGVTGNELWKTDGNKVEKVEDISGNTSPYGLTLADGWLYFAAKNGPTGYEIWRTDGSEEGTEKIVSGFSVITSLSVYEDQVYFAGNDASTGIELWRIKNSAPELVEDIDPAAGFGSNPSAMMVHQGKLYFVADDGTNGRELWQTDGDNSRLVEDINPGPDGSFPGYLTVWKGHLVFAAQGPSSERSLWWTLDSGVAGVFGLNDAGDDMAKRLFAQGDYLLLSGDAGGTGEELQIIAMPEGTQYHLVRDIFPGSNSSNPGAFTQFDGQVFFTATDGTGEEVWVFNLENEDVEKLRDINGSGSSFPEKLVAFE